METLRKRAEMIHEELAVVLELQKVTQKICGGRMDVTSLDTIPETVGWNKGWSKYGKT